MDYEFARQQMIEQQLRTWNVLAPRVLDVLANVPRELFVPEAYQSLAFADTEIPIGHGQSMMAPRVEGRVLQALTLHDDDSVLEIGTGSGYLAACLARLAGTVTSIDIYDDFVQRAGRTLREADIDDVTLLTMDATRELPGTGFDAIVVTGSMPTLETRYVDALNPDGRLFVVVGTAPIMNACIVQRENNGRYRTDYLFETHLTPLVNSRPATRFSF